LTPRLSIPLTGARLRGRALRPGFLAGIPLLVFLCFIPSRLQSQEIPPKEAEPEPSSATQAAKPSEGSRITFHGQLRNETAYRVASPDDFSKVKNYAYLQMTGKISKNFSFDVSTRAYYDAVFDVTAYFNDRVKQNQQWDAELRTAFVDVGLGPLELRLGKQQIVWGQAVNLFFADVVNPKDLREFVLPELDDIRIPMWAANAELFLGNSHLEFVAIPVLDHNKLAVPNSDFTFSTPPVPPGTVMNVADVKQPANTLKNGVYGFRFSQLVGGWDLGAFYLYGYDYFPAYSRRIEAGSSTKPVTVNVEPEIKRMRTYGATFTKDMSGVVLKGELVYNDGKHFVVTDPLDADGLTKSDYFEYLLGLDYTFFGRLDFNVQFFQQFVLDPVDTLFQKDQGSFASVWLKTGFFGNRLEPEIFAVSRLTLGKADYMLRPKLNYTFSSHYRGALGVDLFGGNPNGDFGQFAHANRAYAELRFVF
jgi:hypothetical protein